MSPRDKLIRLVTARADVFSLKGLALRRRHPPPLPQCHLPLAPVVEHPLHLPVQMEVSLARNKFSRTWLLISHNLSSTEEKGMQLSSVGCILYSDSLYFIELGQSFAYLLMRTLSPLLSRPVLPANSPLITATVGSINDNPVLSSLSVL